MNPLLLMRLAGAAVVAVVIGLAVHKYNEWIRAPLRAELDSIAIRLDEQQKHAAAMLAQREKENAAASEKWRQYAKESDEAYEDRISRLRAAGSSGLRIYTPSRDCGGPAGPAQAASPAAPESPAGRQGTGPAAREFVLAESDVAAALRWYAYAESCHKFVNQ